MGNRFPLNQIQKLPCEPPSKSPPGLSVGSNTVDLILSSRRIPGVWLPGDSGRGTQRGKVQQCHSSGFAPSPVWSEQLAAIILVIPLITLC